MKTNISNLLFNNSISLPSQKHRFRFNLKKSKLNFYFLFFCFLFLFFIFQCKSKVSEKNSSSSDPIKNPPTEITISADSIDENQPIGTVIAKLIADGGDRNSYTFSFVSGEGDDDNDSFKIEDLELKTAKSFDFETKNTYKVRIKVTDNNDKSFETAFVIKIKDVFENPSITYAFNSGTKYIEATANDGSIDSSKFITVTVVGIAFKGNNGDKLTLNTDYTVANVPAGLTMEISKLSGTTAKIIFTGKATSHENTALKNDNVNNVTITFNNSAFIGSPDISSVTGKTKNNIAIEYNYQPPVFTYEYTYGFDKDGFIEAGLGNSGGIESLYSLKVFVDHASFVGADGFNFVENTHFKTKNVPNNLNVTMERVIDNDADPLRDSVTTNLILVNFSGQATAHAEANNVNNIEIEFLSDALTGKPDLSAVPTRKKSDIKISFDVIHIERAIDFYDNHYERYVESNGNDGKVSTVETSIFIRGGSTITSVASGSFFPNDNTYYTVTGMPAGLSFKVENVTGNTKVRISVTGQATNHRDSDSTFVTIQFLPKMFQGNPSPSKLYAKFKVAVRFKD